MSFAAALVAVELHPDDPDALGELAREALAEGEEPRALPILAQAAEGSSNGRLWQWRGLLERSLGEQEQALQSLAEAARLMPDDSSIAHGFARVSLEAGLPAEGLFERALRLAPPDGKVLLGLAAARLAAGRAEQARAELEGVLSRSPLWIEGHNELAQLQSLQDRSNLASSTLERAILQSPGQAPLWRALFELHVKRDDFRSLADAVDRARAQGVSGALLRSYEAVAASELEEMDRADQLFAECEAAEEHGLIVWKIRHLLRSGRISELLAHIDEGLAGPQAASIWPYAATAWRLASDNRWDWLYRGGELTSIVDLAPELPPLERLAAVLRSIHTAKGQYLDQSVRGGTQTDGPLFSRIEPEIRKLRSAVIGAVGRYVAQLPPVEAGHPLLGKRRDRHVRFAGSWSVRLRSEGFHVSHVHPQGWISSALYVALPDEGAGEDPNAGWLQLGEPRPELKTGLKPVSLIEPRPGRLVLFPSWMWHGTLPFAAGERLTVAFDVAPPS